MSKRLLHELGHSLSYGRLSLKAKVRWPMLVAASDDQGRGLAECDAVKWYVCPNVPEITIDDVPELLQEMAEQEMIAVYDTERGQTYQMVRWWEYQQLQWARPSKYDPPDGWQDRVRYSDRGDYYTDGWDTTGGFDAELRETPTPKQDKEPPRKPPRKQPPDELDAQPNLTQSNLTQSNSCPTGADAPGESVQTPRTFKEWEAALDTYSNHPALVRRMVELLYPGLDPPDFGFIGKIAKQMGRGRNGYRRLMGLLWEYSARPPQGDLLPYLLRVHQGKERAAASGNGKGDANAPPKDPIIVKGIHRTPEWLGGDPDA